jgi:hypothetical protein
MTFKQDFFFTGGYDSRQPEMRPDGAPTDILAYGSTNLLYQGLGHLESFKGLTITNPVTGGRILLNFSTGYVSLNDYDPGGGNIQGAGSIFISYGKSLWFVGAGKVYWNGADLTCTASSTLSFRKLASGVYTGTSYSAGEAQPSAPTVAARTSSFGAGITGLLNGTYSVCITRIRSSSGAESIRSTPSAVVSVVNGSMRITFPALDSNGQDKWGLYVTLAGFGLTGPYLLLQEVADSSLTTVDGIGRSIELEWADGTPLEILAPIDNYQPPVCTHATQLEDVTCAIGAYGDSVSGVTSTAPGNAIAPSLPGFPEAYPPDQLLFLPQSPVHVLQRPADRVAWILMSNSIAALSYTGGTPAVSLEIVWENIGCSAPHNACLVDGRLYAFAGGKLVRMGIGGEPEETWSDAIMREVRGFTAANVVLGYDPTLKILAVCHGSTIYPFHTSSEKWGAPITISGVSGTIQSAVTVNNRLLITVNNAGTFNLYQFHVGSGSTWQAYSNWSDGGDSLRKKTIYTVGYSFQHDDATTHPDVTVKIFKNTSTGSLDNTSAAKTITHTIPSLSPAAYAPRAKRINVRSARQFQVMMSAQSAGADSRPIKISVEGEISESV